MASEGKHIASQAECVMNRVPLRFRDSCSALNIPLNKCRRKNAYLPWKCEHERHAYEKCQYEDYLRRMKETQKFALKKKEAEAED